jgi:hypothetical protein
VPFDRVLVIGAAVPPYLEAALEENGFKHFSQTSEGFEARF